MDDRYGVKAMDLFLYSREPNWKTNPVMLASVYNDGSLVKTPSETTCETMTIILGEEGKLRRRCQNLDEFIGSWPDIQPLGPTNSE